MTVTAIVTCHANVPGLHHILGNLRYQTRPPDETIVYYCCITPGEALRTLESFPEATLRPDDCQDDFGHQKRSRGLTDATSDWVGFFSDDDDYDRTYLEQLTAAAGEDTVAVCCEWKGTNSPRRVDFKAGSSTSGNFLVRADIGKHVGWQHRHYEADGAFIDRVAELGPVVRVPEVLYFHNGGVVRSEVSA